MKSLYGDLDKLDLFLGGMLEEPVHGGLLGPTFSCIVGEQVTDLLFIYRIIAQRVSLYRVGQNRLPIKVPILLSLPIATYIVLRSCLILYYYS